MSLERSSRVECQRDHQVLALALAGTANDDIAKHTLVLEKGEDGWKMVHGHRATGQKPQSVGM